MGRASQKEEGKGRKPWGRGRGRGGRGGEGREGRGRGGRGGGGEGGEGRADGPQGCGCRWPGIPAAGAPCSAGLQRRASTRGLPGVDEVRGQEGCGSERVLGCGSERYWGVAVRGYWGVAVRGY